MGFRLGNLEGRAVLVDGADLYDVASCSDGALPADPVAALARAPELSQLAQRLEERSAVAQLMEVELGPPVPRPAKIFAIGLNYRAHAEEGDFEVPKHPLVFTKFPTCITGPNSDVAMRSDRCDYEGELVVVIGEPAKDLTKAEALAAVAGFTVGQDISDRRTQFAAKPVHFALGKSFDTFGPIGPVVASPDLVRLDTARLETWINDEARQSDVLGSMLFDVPTLVAYLSRVTSLEPGDLIFTGTPEGVGALKRQYLSDGDVVRTTIEGIGTIRNRCVRVQDHGLGDLVS
ncbi:MAG: fumarylacetoacetate hydrolase family protein [Myxococcota bacterium]